MEKNLKEEKRYWKNIFLVYLLTIFTSSVFAQQGIPIKGTVTDVDGNPIPGVTVVVKGTATGSVTDGNGNYTINAPNREATLVYSFLGYAEFEQIVGERTIIDVVMNEDSQLIDEVIVVGYGTQRKANLTGAVSAVKVDEVLASRSISNVSSALSGMVPGLLVQQSSGMAGNNGASLLIRGLGTVNNANPLIVVDGMPDVDINRIDMNDIESISVLKDASSSSIYGSRAANGVILITTKTGKDSQKLSINFTGSLALSTPTNFYNPLVDYPKALTLHQQAARAGRTTSAFKDGTIDEWMHMSMLDPVNYPSENQYDWVTRTGALQTYNLSVSGSSAKNNFYLSIGMMDEKGYLINNDNKRYNFRLNMDQAVGEKFKVGARMDGQWTNMSYPFASGFYANEMLLEYAITGIYPYNEKTGQYGGVMAYGETPNANNVYAYYNGMHNLKERQEFNGNVYGEWNIIKGLTARADFGLRYYNQFVKAYNDPGLSLYNFQTGTVAMNLIPASAGVTDNYASGYKSLTQFLLRYDTEFMEGHRLNLMTAYNEEYWFDRSGAAGRDERIHPNITEVNGALTKTQRTGGESSAEGLRSYLGRLNYNIHDKYLLELNFRVDGSSKFLPGHQYGFFPSGSMGWRFSEENFFDRLKSVISSGKFRASYGSLGNNTGVARYEQKNTFKTTTYAFNGNNLVSGFAPTKMINSDFTWEKTTVANLGLDLGFLNNKLQAEIDLYDRKTTGMIRPSQLSSLLSGYSAPRMNIGDMRNRGVELTLKWFSSVKKFNYGSIFNYSHNWETLLSWNELLNPGNVFLGMPYQFTYSQVSTGLAQTWEDIANAVYQNNNNMSPGDVLYADLNGDGQSTGADQKAYKNKMLYRPRANYSLNLFGSWKGIGVNMLFQATTGRMGFWQDRLNNTNVGSGRYAFQEWHLYDTWSLENRNSSLPRLVQGSTPRNSESSTYWLQRMDYLRMKNLQVSYDLSSLSTLRAIGVDNLRVFASAENVFTLTPWKGIDPEKNNQASEPYPLMRSVSIGLNLGF